MKFKNILRLAWQAIGFIVMYPFLVCFGLFRFIIQALSMIFCIKINWPKDDEWL